MLRMFTGTASFVAVALALLLAAALLSPTAEGWRPSSSVVQRFSHQRRIPPASASAASCLHRRSSSPSCSSPRRSFLPVLPTASSGTRLFARTGKKGRQQKQDQQLDDDAADDEQDQKQKQKQQKQDQEQTTERTTFDEAGRSLVAEEDQARMEEMGDFDENPSYKTDSIEKMRAAIKARTADLGIEKSKISAEYVQKKKEEAMQYGPGGATSPDQFAGLDLSKISSEPTKDKGDNWNNNEDMPSMFYDPDAELTKEEQEEVDPIMKLNPIEQALHEFNNAKWPTFGAAIKEVGLLLLVVAFSAVLIINWDKLLRELYTSVGFIPTQDDILNYANRFEGLDLPTGWTDNMSDQDVSQFTDTVSTNLP